MRPPSHLIEPFGTEPFRELCHYMETHYDEALPLRVLANMAGLSPGHFQRQFKAAVGVSPKQYLEACRLGKLKAELRAGSNVTQAVYEAGFGSASRVYEKIDTRLGMTPRQYRNGGKGLSISYASAPSSLGPLMMGATDRGLCFIQFGKPVPKLLDALRQEFPRATLSAIPPASTEQFEHWMHALESHLQGTAPQLALPLDIQGTAFQLKVWHYLQGIPYGEVRSYTEVAQGIGQPKAARAVASACAANTLAIAIPCHRVIRGNGELGGYRWGVDVKRMLLAQEKHPRETTCLES